VLQVLLSDIGHEAVLARDGLEAWEIIQGDASPPLAILDWMMPGMDGVEICRALRHQQKKPYPYLIMLTARNQIEDLVEGMGAGADDYLRKPFDMRELRARLHAGERILALQDELRARATFDDLTKILNRATILERVEREVTHVTRKGGAASVVLVDLDDFKRVNDTHGHGVGDEVLCVAAKRLAASMRSYDELGRYGGEEFLAVLPDCPAPWGLEVANRMRNSLNALPVRTSTVPIVLTASFGVATVDKVRQLNVDELILEADKALYRAKRSGRNRVEGA
jgi:diguanylate cyclase (GGDEF)-like protein